MRNQNEFRSARERERERERLIRGKKIAHHTC
jgi:hypothetical protein